MLRCTHVYVCALNVSVRVSMEVVSGGVFVRTHACIYVWLCAGTCVCVHVYMCLMKCVHVDGRACISACLFHCGCGRGQAFFMCVCVCVHALMRVYVRTRVSNCVRLYSYMRAYMRQRLRTYVRACTFPIYDRACAHIIVEAGVGVA